MCVPREGYDTAVLQQYRPLRWYRLCVFRERCMIMTVWMMARTSLRDLEGGGEGEGEGWICRNQPARAAENSHSHSHSHSQSKGQSQSPGPEAEAEAELGGSSKVGEPEGRSCCVLRGRKLEPREAAREDQHANMRRIVSPSLLGLQMPLCSSWILFFGRSMKRSNAGFFGWPAGTHHVSLRN